MSDDETIPVRNPIRDMEASNAKKRKIMLVIQDVGEDRFTFTMQGDTERMGSDEVGVVPTAAEHWAVKFYEACQRELQGTAKKLNRSERRK